MTDIIQQIEELQEECGHEWHLFIGGPETPEEWRGKCSYRRGDGTWSDELAGGMTAGRFYRIRRIVAVPPPCTHRRATEEDMQQPMPKDTLYQDIETGEWLRPAFHDWRRSDKTPYAVPKDWKPERTEPEAPKSVALFRINEEKAIYAPLAYFRNIEAANQFCRDMFGQDLEEEDNKQQTASSEPTQQKGNDQ